MSEIILVINPGSTSTKIAVYDGNNETFTKTIEHELIELDKFDSITDQYPLRKNSILSVLKKNKINLNDLKCIMARGGAGLKSVKSGGYIVNDKMLERLKTAPIMEHASNLAAVIAKDIADQVGCNAYIYDSVTIDELKEVAKITGLPEIPRVSAFHALNSRAMAMKVAEEKNINYFKTTFIVAHLGGGITLCVLENGQAIDICSDDEGPFSPERAGGIHSSKIVELCYNRGFDYPTMKKKIRGKGGVRAYLNTIDMQEVRERVNHGDDYAKLIRNAMIYQIAKAVGSLATTVCGKVDYIVLTGSIARDKYIVTEIEKRVGFIAEVCVKSGENEMVALAGGAYRILKGEEKAQKYIEL